MILNRTVAIPSNTPTSDTLVPCNPTTMQTAMIDCMSQPPPQAGPQKPLEDRLTQLKTQLEEWARNEGVASIQHALGGKPTTGFAPIHQCLCSSRLYPELRVPPRLYMALVIPYLKTTHPDRALQPTHHDSPQHPLTPFWVSSDSLKNPGYTIRNWITNAISPTVCAVDKDKLIYQLVGLLATMSSQEDGHQKIQDALFELNKKGKSAFHYLFMGGENGAEIDQILLVLSVLFAFGLDVQRFNNTFSHPLAHCLTAFVAVHTTHHSVPDHYRPIRCRILNELIGLAIPPCLSEVTAEDLKPDSIAGCLSGMHIGDVASTPDDKWMCLSLPGNPANRIVEPLSWFKKWVADTPMVLHPTTREAIPWNIDDLYSLGIMTAVNQKTGWIPIRDCIYDSSASGPMKMRQVSYLNEIKHDKIMRQFNDQLIRDGIIPSGTRITLSPLEMYRWGVVLEYHPYIQNVGWVFGGCGTHYERSNNPLATVTMIYPFKVYREDHGITITTQGKPIRFSGHSMQAVANAMGNHLLTPR